MTLDLSEAALAGLHAFLAEDIEARLARGDTAGAAQQRMVSETMARLARGSVELAASLRQERYAAGVARSRAVEEARREADLAAEAIQAGVKVIQGGRAASGEISPLRRYHRAMTAWEECRAAKLPPARAATEAAEGAR